MNTFNSGWHLIYTRPQQERKVSSQLLEKRIQTYLPLTRQVRKWSDRTKIISAPLFPSYVFVYLKSVHDYYDGIGAGGACYYVKTGKRAAVVSDEEIGYIKMMETGGMNLEVTDQRLMVGQQLVIQKGPLTGLSCEVVQHKGRKRILVRISILQRSILADLPFTAFQ